jgi:hypothetical protein
VTTAGREGRWASRTRTAIDQTSTCGGGRAGAFCNQRLKALSRRGSLLDRSNDSAAVNFKFPREIRHSQDTPQAPNGRAQFVLSGLFHVLSNIVEIVLGGDHRVFAVLGHPWVVLPVSAE